MQIEEKNMQDPVSGKEVLVKFEDFSVLFKTLDGMVQALDSINLDLSEGEILGIIGESGSGKSTTALSLLSLLSDNARTKGIIKYLDSDIVNSTDSTTEAKISKRKLRKARKNLDQRLMEIRWKEISMIFQGAMNAFNPVHTIKHQIMEVFEIHNIFIKKVEKNGEVSYVEDLELINNMDDLIDEGNLRYKAFQLATERVNDPEAAEFKAMQNKLYHDLKDEMRNKISTMSDKEKKRTIIQNRIETSCRKAGFNIKFLDSYPHELSGGMKQRAIIAMALALNPKVVIADEPTTGLDVITQAKIIKELKDLKDRKVIKSMIVISHDVGVVSQLANYVAVMYAGRIMEYGEPKDIFVNPKNPYTYALMRSYPSIDSTKKRIHGIPGSVPDLLNPPKGCFFASRCFMAEKICFEERPELKVLSSNHKSLCHFDNISVEKYENSQIFKSELKQDTDSNAQPLLLESKELSKFYTVHSTLTTNLFGGANKPIVHAVDGVDIQVRKGTIIGVVGESGSGKTTLGKLLVNALEPTKGSLRFVFEKDEDEPKDIKDIESSHEPSQFGAHSPEEENSMLEEGFEEIDIIKLSKLSSKYSQYRKEAQLIFQDPYDSINPKMSIFDIVSEPLLVQKKDILSRRARDRLAEEMESPDKEKIAEEIEKENEGKDPLYELEKEIERLDTDEFDLEREVVAALETANLKPAQHYLERYPHELSGGERQRVSIARAITLNPSFLVADEPISMLDVSIRANVMNLLIKLKEEKEISVLYISHDIASARYVSDFIVVMYLGQIVEFGRSEDIIKSPLHPYTKALISAVPSIDPSWVNKNLGIVGEIGSAINPKPGCRFYGRCIFHKDICKEEDPQYKQYDDRYYKCHFAQEELVVENSMLELESVEE